MMALKVDDADLLLPSNTFILTILSSQALQLGHHHIHPLLTEEESVRSLIRRQSWTKLEKVLDCFADEKTSNDDNSTILSIQAGFVGETRQENALHQACRKLAPLFIIQKLCSLCPNLLMELDSQQRTPLHVAAEKRANCKSQVAIIEFLLKQNVHAAFIQDVDKRTPLHLACIRENSMMKPVLAEKPNLSLSKLLTSIGEFFSKILSRGGEILILEGVLRALCKANPGAINQEDAAGMGPIEHAIESEVDFSILSKLWAVSENQWKKTSL